MDEGSLSLPPFTGYDEKSLRDYHLALRGNSLNPMIDAATPLLGMVMRLSTMNSQTMPEHLFAQVVTDVQAVEQLLQEQGYEPGVIISFRYILCTFIDEAALGNGWSNKNEWIKQSLLVHFHNEAWGGEKVFILLERLIREPKRYQDLLEFLWLCFSLGFRGRYKVAAQEQGEFEQIYRRLYHVLHKLRGNAPFPLLHQDKKTQGGRYQLISRLTIKHIFLWWRCRAGVVLPVLSVAAGQPDAGHPVPAKQITSIRTFMIQIDLPTLVKRLNLFSRQALEMAASECMSQQAAEITVSHVLIQMLAMPRSDLRVITRQGDIGMEELRQALTVENYTTARSADSYPAFSPMLVEWLKEGWLLASAEMQHSELRGGVLLLALLHSPLRYIPPAAAQLLTGINRDRLQQDFVQWTQESAESVVPDADCKGAGALTDVADSLLARYAKNMTEDARNDRLDPVLCRDHEIDLMIDILCRRRKNNPVVVGEAGVGKSALIEGLALRIVAGQVPDKLKNTDIMTLDLGALQAGASVKGEFEKRFKGLMAEVISSPVPVILFIDEAHTLIGAGNQQGGLDISNLLKPALARGELKTIAATTWSEYKKYFEKDAALSRRFQLVKVSEPNAAEATIILRGLSAVYEQSHGVLIDDDALQAAATLSERYLSGRQLPDKAIDVLDTACARVAINLSSPPKQISALTTLSHQQEAEIRQLERELRIGLRTNTSRMTEVLVQYDETLTALDELEAAWHQQQTLVQEIIALRQQLLGMAEDDAASLPHVDAVEDTPPESEQDNTGAEPADEAGSEQPEETAETVSPVQRLAHLTAELDALHNDRLLVSPHVDKKQIAAVIAEWTGVPLNRLSQNEMSVITDLPKWLGDTIKGQDLAIASLHKHLLTARADLRRPGRPLGAFLLAGPSGVGKTETVLQLAELLYGGRQYLTTINMSEFQEKHTVSRLIGSPPGYVGYGEGGVLTEAIRQKPYSVVLLDEVEKAHPDVLNLFYQAFDKGEMADGEGRLIDCKNIVFFLTSNLGYQVIVEHADDPETMQEVLYPVLADFFKPALLARMEVVPYLPLSKETLATIIAGKLARLDNVLRSRFGAEVIIEPEVTDEIMSRVTRAENGARMLESVIDGNMLPPLSLLLLQKMAANTAVARIRLSAVDGAFTADVEDAQNDESVTKDETVL